MSTQLARRLIGEYERSIDLYEITRLDAILHAVLISDLIERSERDLASVLRLQVLIDGLLEPVVVEIFDVPVVVA